MGKHSLPGYGPVISVNHPMRTHMPGDVEMGSEKLGQVYLYLFIEILDKRIIYLVVYK